MNIRYIKAKDTKVVEPKYELNAPEGKVYRRKIDGVVFGKGVNLGVITWLKGVKLEVPIIETEKDFELVEEEVRYE